MLRMLATYKRFNNRCRKITAKDKDKMSKAVEEKDVSPSGNAERSKLAKLGIAGAFAAAAGGLGVVVAVAGPFVAVGAGVGALALGALSLAHPN